MPIFEFVCKTCDTGRKFSALVGVVADAAPPACPKCGGGDLQKQVSRFARVRSEDETLDALATQADNMDENDPRAMRQLMKEMTREMGEDADGEDLDQLMDEALDAEASGDTSGGGDAAGDD